MSFGVLMTTASDDPESQARLAAFVKALKELGWTDGRNVQFHFRFGTGVATTGKHAAETHSRRTWSSPKVARLRDRCCKQLTPCRLYS
jgi:hypothetical protein